MEKELEKLVESDIIGKDGKPLIMKIGRFGRYLTSQDEDSKENISLKVLKFLLRRSKVGRFMLKIKSKNY